MEEKVVFEDDVFESKKENPFKKAWKWTKNHWEVLVAAGVGVVVGTAVTSKADKKQLNSACETAYNMGKIEGALDLSERILTVKNPTVESNETK